MNETAPAPDILEKSHRAGDAHLLREVFRAHQAILAVFSRAVGIPASRLALMRLLAVAGPDAIGVMEIARQLGVNAAAVTRQVKEMEKERLVVRLADARDKRRSGVQLSPQGRRLFERLHERSHRLERALGSVVSAEEMRIAVKTLVALRGVLDGLR